MTTQPPPSRVDLYWIPLGAGDRVVRRAGRIYEALVAARARRDRCDLYHAALEVHLDSRRYVIEMAPVWDRPEAQRGTVSEGAVGLAWLGRFRAFRYETRCWPDGLIPDVAAAVDSPHRLSEDDASARGVLDAVTSFPTATWGRDELRTADMWNSNSLVAWALARSGHAAERVRTPAGGRAPGWQAGLTAAARIGTGPQVDTAH